MLNPRQLLEKTRRARALRFEVNDSGIGIPPEAMPAAVLELQAADNTTTRKYGGTGSAWPSPASWPSGWAARPAPSTPGVGSTFWFTCGWRDGTTRTAHRSTGAGRPADTLKRRYAGTRFWSPKTTDQPQKSPAADPGRRSRMVVVMAVDGAQAVDLVAHNDYSLV